MVRAKALLHDSEDRSKTLQELLAETRTLKFDVGDDTEKEEDNDDDLTVEPIRLRWKSEKPAIDLDWWSEKAIKPWAGSMKERMILHAMLAAVDPDRSRPFDDLRRVQYQSPKLTKAASRRSPKRKSHSTSTHAGETNHIRSTAASPPILTRWRPIAAPHSKPSASSACNVPAPGQPAARTNPVYGLAKAIAGRSRNSR